MSLQNKNHQVYFVNETYDSLDKDTFYDICTANPDLEQHLRLPFREDAKKIIDIYNSYDTNNKTIFDAEMEYKQSKN